MVRTLAKLDLWQGLILPNPGRIQEPKTPDEIGLTAPNTEFPNAKSAPWIFDHKFISQAI